MNVDHGFLVCYSCHQKAIEIKRLYIREVIMDQEGIVNTPFPPYFDRFIDERDRRLISELARLDTNIHHNLKHIDQLRREIERGVAEAKEYHQSGP